MARQETEEDQITEKLNETKSVGVIYIRCQRLEAKRKQN